MSKYLSLYFQFCRHCLPLGQFLILCIRIVQKVYADRIPFLSYRPPGYRAGRKPEAAGKPHLLRMGETLWPRFTLSQSIEILLKVSFMDWAATDSSPCPPFPDFIAEGGYSARPRRRDLRVDAFHCSRFTSACGEGSAHALYQPAIFAFGYTGTARKHTSLQFPLRIAYASGYPTDSVGISLV